MKTKTTNRTNKTNEKRSTTGRIDFVAKMQTEMRDAVIAKQQQLIKANLSTMNSHCIRRFQRDYSARIISQCLREAVQCIFEDEKKVERLLMEAQNWTHHFNHRNVGQVRAEVGNIRELAKSVCLANKHAKAKPVEMDVAYGYACEARKHARAISHLCSCSDGSLIVDKKLWLIFQMQANKSLTQILDILDSDSESEVALEIATNLLSHAYKAAPSYSTVKEVAENLAHRCINLAQSITSSVSNAEKIRKLRRLAGDAARVVGFNGEAITLSRQISQVFDSIESRIPTLGETLGSFGLSEVKVA